MRVVRVGVERVYIGKNMTEQRSSSPPRARENTMSEKKDGIEGSCVYALGILKRFDASSRVLSVVKNDDIHLIKMQLGAESTATVHMAALAALRVAFPFSSVAITEDVLTGESIFQLLIANNLLAIRHARDQIASSRPFQMLRLTSNLSAVLGTAIFCSLMYAHCNAVSQAILQ